MFAPHETPPASTNPVRKAWGWARKNLFSSWFNTLLTLLCLWVICNVIPPALNWLVFQANWLGTRADCTKEGACWVFIHARFGQFMYGLYPHELRWRINLALVTGLLSIIRYLSSRCRAGALYRLLGRGLSSHRLVPDVRRFSRPRSR
jgi:general L-amino acid transport system permease protein